MPPHPPPPPGRHVPSSVISGFIDADRIDALLAPWVADAKDRAFVVRCVLKEGPAHHRGANYVLLSLLGDALARLPAQSPQAPSGGGVRVPLRLPPHLQGTTDASEYPLELPLAPLARLAGGDRRKEEAMADCLTDGPPQHALANVVMVLLLEELLARLSRLEAGP